MIKWQQQKIMKILQSHENSINRDENAKKKMKDSIDTLENTISLEKKITEAYIGLSSIKQFAASATQHLERM